MATYKIFPAMQSNTVPRPYTLSQSGGTEAYLAFDDNLTTKWSTTTSGDYILINIPETITSVTQINISPVINATTATVKIEGSTDNVQWEDLLSSDITTGSYTYNFESLPSYKYIKISLTATGITDIGFSEVELYGNRATDPQTNITINQVNMNEVPDDTGYENSKQIYMTPNDGIFMHKINGEKHQVSPGVHTIKPGTEISIEGLENSNVEAQLKFVKQIIDNIKTGVVGKVVNLTVTSDGQEVLNTGIRLDGTGDLQATTLDGNIYLNGQYITSDNYTLSNSDGEMIITWYTTVGDDKLLQDDIVSIHYCDTSAVSPGGGSQTEYVHPDTHPASMIVEDDTRKFVTSEEKAKINTIQDTATILTQAADFTNTAISNLVNSSPEALDTLNELAAALGNDPNFSTTVLNQIANKVDKDGEKGLSTNDYTTEHKTLVETIPTMTDDITNLKGIAVDFKTNMASAINDKANTALAPTSTNQEFLDTINGLSLGKWINPINIGNVFDNSAPYQFYGGGIVELNGEIHILGSLASGNAGTGHYKFNGKYWQLVSIIPYKFYSGPAVVYNNEIHILGTGTNHYKFDGTTWTSVSTLPYTFTRGAAVVYNNEIHILGGSSGTTNHYRFDGTTWTSVSTLPYTFTFGSVIVYDNEIHMLGGSTGGTNHYKFDGTTWTSVSTLPYNGYHSKVVVYDNSIQLLGGQNNPTIHYKFDGTTWTSVSTLPYSFYNGGAVVYNDKICIMGGLGSNTGYFEFNGTMWSSIRSLPFNAFGGSVVVYNGEIHAFGNNSSVKGEHYKYDGKNWISINAPHSFYSGSAVVYNNEIHVLGAETDHTIHYKFDGTSWVQASTISQYILGCAAVVYNNEIHVLGSDNEYRIHCKYDGSTWTTLSELPYDVWYGSAVVYNGEIHILGGQDNATNHYKFDGTTWTSVSTLPYSFYASPAVVYNGEIHILGGQTTDVMYNHYKFDGTTWTSVSTLPYDTRESSALVYDDELYIIGGTMQTYLATYNPFTGWRMPNYNKLKFKYTSNMIIYTDVPYEINDSFFTINDNYTYLTIVENDICVFIDLSKSKVYLPTGKKLNGTSISSDGIYSLPPLSYIE